MSVTALDLLKAAREYAADPEHIVICPLDVYEDAQGNVTTAERAVRGCLLGNVGIVARARGISPTGNQPTLTAALSAMDRACRDYEATLRRGHAAVLATYDAAIAEMAALS